MARVETQKQALAGLVMLEHPLRAALDSCAAAVLEPCWRT